MVVRICKSTDVPGLADRIRDPTGACRAWECGALAYTTIEKTDGRPGLVGRAARGAAVCAAVALLSGCGGWPYIGAVQPPEMPPIAQPAPAPWPPIISGTCRRREPSLPPPAAPPEPAPPVARPDTSGDDGDPASLLPVPPAPGRSSRRGHGGQCLAAKIQQQNYRRWGLRRRRPLRRRATTMRAWALGGFATFCREAKNMKFSEEAGVCAALVWVACSRNLTDEDGRWRPMGWVIVIGGALGWYADAVLDRVSLPSLGCDPLSSGAARVAAAASIHGATARFGLCGGRVCARGADCRSALRRGSFLRSGFCKRRTAWVTTISFRAVHGRAARRVLAQSFR